MAIELNIKGKQVTGKFNFGAFYKANKLLSNEQNNDGAVNLFYGIVTECPVFLTDEDDGLTEKQSACHAGDAPQQPHGKRQQGSCRKSGSLFLKGIPGSAQEDQQSDKRPDIEKPAPSAPAPVKGCKKKKYV